MPVCTRFRFLPVACVPTCFSTRESHVWDNEGNEELSGNSGETEATVAKHMTRRTFVAAACGAVAAAACGPVTAAMLGCAKQNANDSAWTWEEDADLPVLCMEVSGGAIVAMPGNGWKPQDEWIQLQLSGGSIPGKEIEAITQEGSTLVVRLKKPKSDMETMDLCLTEYRWLAAMSRASNRSWSKTRASVSRPSSVSTAKFVPCNRRNATCRFLR